MFRTACMNSRRPKRRREQGRYSARAASSNSHDQDPAGHPATPPRRAAAGLLWATVMQDHNALAIEWRAIEEITPYARNPRIIPDAAVEKVAASIREFGWRQPIVVDEAGVILVGHTRRLAALKLGHAKVPVHVAAGLTPAQTRAYRLADNRVGEDTGWSLPELQFEIGALAEFDFSLDALGFGADDLERMFEGMDAEPVGEDVLPQLPTQPVTRRGDLWELGAHRLLCGDATSATDVERLLGGAAPALMVTDPPYGVEYDPSWRHRAGVNVSKRRGKVLNDEIADWRAAWALFPGDVAYVWHAGLHGHTVAESLVASGFAIRSQIIWAKPRFVLGRGDYHWQHEPCFYAVRAGKPGRWRGSRKESTLWQVEAMGDEDAATVHGTQKPVECMRRPIVNSSRKGEAVYEPFAGSGSTVVAAERTGRACFAMELAPAYCDLIVERWQRLTGNEAALLNGSSFAETRSRREAEQENDARTAAPSD